ncbi:MAG: succinylglutamate desuccinylase/aspartoacylase family protein [Patescibacteria group bacterium]
MYVSLSNPHFIHSMQPLPLGVTRVDGKQPGPTSVIMAGVHGNEQSGLLAFKQYTPLRIQRGTVFMVLGNPKAVERGIRYIEENLNRCFLVGKAGASYEARRAAELAPILDQASALLDLHASNSRHTTPFIIAEGAGITLAQFLPFTIISTGWAELEPGSTDSYMHSQGKIGLCAECGSIFDPGTATALAHQAIQGFLLIRKHVDGVQPKMTAKRYIPVTTIGMKQSADFRFAKDFSDFEVLPANQPFAWDGEMTYRAKPNQRIIFPRPDTPIGGEVFILGEEHSSP